MKMHSIPAVVLTLFFKIARTSPIFDALPSINDPEHDQITVPNPLSNPSSWNFFGEKYQDGFPTSDSKLVSFNSMNLDLNPELKDPQAQFSVPDTQLNQPIVPLPLPQHTGSINGGLELASSASSNLFLSNLDSQTDLRLPSSLPSYKFIRDGSGVCWRCPQRNNEKIYFATCDGQNLNCSRCKPLLPHRESGFITWH